MEPITIVKQLFAQNGRRPAKVLVQYQGAQYEMVYWTGRGINSALGPGDYMAQIALNRAGDGYVIEAVNGGMSAPMGAPMGGGPQPAVARPYVGGAQIPVQSMAPQPAQAPLPVADRGEQIVKSMCFKIAADIFLATPLESRLQTLSCVADDVWRQYQAFIASTEVADDPFADE